MDVQQELLARVQSLGHPSISSFLSAHPGEPYGKLLRLIATKVKGKNYFDIPIFALKEAHRREAIELGNMREFAKDTLTRSLRDNLRGGWKSSKSWEDVRAEAYSSWSIPPGKDEICERVWQALKNLDPPVGWRPAVTDDVFVNKAFDIGWPLEKITDGVI